MYLHGLIESDADHGSNEYLPGSRNSGSVCGPWRLKAGPALGVEKGLAYLCKKAEALGITIVSWMGPAHLSHSSPILKEHPEWIALAANGKPDHWGYKDIVGVNLKKGYLDYAARQFEKTIKKTGLRGVWIDSFCTFGILTDFSEKDPYPQLE